jgi:hypothetical protein
MTYSKEEIIILNDFYYDKIIGEILEESTGCRVSEIEITPIGNDKYAMRVYCEYSGVTLWREITDTAQKLNLPLPAEVLQRV